MKATKVISARVPVDVAEMFESMCIQEGLSKSDALRNMISNPSMPSTGVMDIGGTVDKVGMPEELTLMLSGVGGFAVGRLVYGTLDTFLPKDGRLDPELRELLCFLGAVAGGLASAYGLHKMLRK